ncbi:MAG: AAA family ATPase, partial [Clostridiaceae bacterium]
MKFTTMLRAHRAAKKVLMFWGSSGFGKTATVKAYVKEDGLNLILRNAVYLDPLNCWIPRDDDSGDYIVDKPHKWVHEVLTATKPTVLFLDELTRCRSVQIMNMLTELIL